MPMGVALFYNMTMGAARSCRGYPVLGIEAHERGAEASQGKEVMLLELRWL